MIATLLADKYYSNPGYGTSELNSNIDSAYDFWINWVVDPNPRIDALTKAVLRGMGEKPIRIVKRFGLSGMTNKRPLVFGAIFALIFHPQQMIQIFLKFSHQQQIRVPMSQIPRFNYQSGWPLSFWRRQITNSLVDLRRRSNINLQIHKGVKSCLE